MLDLGGLPRQLEGFLTESEVVAANVRTPADVIIPADHLPFADASFTATTSLDVLEHVPPAEPRARSSRRCCA